MLNKKLLFNDDGVMYPWALQTLWWGKTAYGLNCDIYVQENPSINTRTELFSNNRIAECLMDTMFKGCVVLWKPDFIGDFKNFTAITRADKTIGMQLDWLPVGATVCFKTKKGEKVGTITGHIPAGMAPIELFPDKTGYSSATYRFTLDRVTDSHRYVICTKEQNRNKTAYYAVPIREAKPISEREYLELHPGERFQKP